LVPSAATHTVLSIEVTTMHALLVNGPMAKQQITVADPPPNTVRMDEVRRGEIEWVPPAAGAEPARMPSVTHPYSLVGVEPIPSPLGPAGLNPLAIYVHAPELAEGACAAF
jgi:hypothetical protein